MDHRAAGLGPVAWRSSHPATCLLVAVGLVASLPAAAAAACPSPPIPGWELVQPPCPLLQRGCPQLAGPGCNRGGILAAGAWCGFAAGLAGAPGVRVTLWREAGGRCLFAPGCLGGDWWWLPGVTLQVLLLLLWSCSGSTGCARGCCGHAGEGRRRGQVEGCWEVAVASASTVIES